MTNEDAVKAVNSLLWELPAEFREPLPLNPQESREQFLVLGRTNVRKIHRSLQALQVALGMVEND